MQLTNWRHEIQHGCRMLRERIQIALRGELWQRDNFAAVGQLAQQRACETVDVEKWQHTRQHVLMIAESRARNRAITRVNVHHHAVRDDVFVRELHSFRETRCAAIGLRFILRILLRSRSVYKKIFGRRMEEEGLTSSKAAWPCHSPDLARMTSTHSSPILIAANQIERKKRREEKFSDADGSEEEHAETINESFTLRADQFAKIDAVCWNGSVGRLLDVHDFYRFLGHLDGLLQDGAHACQSEEHGCIAVEQLTRDFVYI
jgi:hypothetical protein